MTIRTFLVDVGGRRKRRVDAPSKVGAALVAVGEDHDNELDICEQEIKVEGETFYVTITREPPRL